VFSYFAYFKIEIAILFENYLCMIAVVVKSAINSMAAFTLDNLPDQPFTPCNAHPK
jgi:hypothetical protein